jgi:hypothetical protein
VGQDRHHVAANRTELVIVVDPTGPVELAQAIECRIREVPGRSRGRLYVHCAELKIVGP